MKFLLPLAAALVGLAPLARATWSIVVVDTRTGEVCVASATCLNGFELKPALCVMRVGEGGAAAQSVIDASGTNRLRIWDGLVGGATPQAILDTLAANDPQHQRRQYGIASLRGEPITFTGTMCGQARAGVFGTTGDLRYSIQGNLLTGALVVEAAEDAFLAASGDLGTRVLAAMEAARALGGDGRCSCHPSLPTSCGVPPPSFTYSARTGFLCWSRLGDVDGVCNAVQGCANGEYYCDLKYIVGQQGSLDPVDGLAERFQTFRQGRLAYADHLRTRIEPRARSLVADGLARTSVDVQLVNLEGEDVVFTPTTLDVQALAPSIAVAGPVTDLGRGRFVFDVIAGLEAGVARFVVRAQQPGTLVQFAPALEVRVDPLAELHAGQDAVSASAPASVPLVVNAASDAGVPFVILASSSGTAPGIVFQGAAMPLVRDRLLAWSVRAAGTPPFVGTSGLLDVHGRAEAAFEPSSATLAPLVGRRVHWSAWLGGPAPRATLAVGVDVVP